MIEGKNEKFQTQFLKLAPPIIMANLFSFAVSFSDSLMIGALGADATSAVYLAGQLSTLVIIFMGGIEAASMVFVSKSWGAQDEEKVKIIIGCALVFASVFAILISFICITVPKPLLFLIGGNEKIAAIGEEYLRILGFSFLLFIPSQTLCFSMRSIEKCTIGTTVSLVSLLINITLNFFLIYGMAGFPALGIIGAAISTLISRAVEFSISAFYVFCVDKKLKLRPASLFKIKSPDLKAFLKGSLPIMASQGVWAVNTFFSSFILSRAGENTLAAAAPLNVINSFSYVLINGTAGAVGIMTSKHLGEGHSELISGYKLKVATLSLALGSLLALLSQIVKEALLSFYNIGDAAKADAIALIGTLSFIIIFNSFSSATLTGIMKSLGMTKFVFKLDAALVFLLIIPLGLISLKLSLPPAIIYLALRCDQIPKATVGLFKLLRLKPGRRLRLHSKYD